MTHLEGESLFCIAMAPLGSGGGGLLESFRLSYCGNGACDTGCSIIIVGVMLTPKGLAFRKSAGNVM